MDDFTLTEEFVRKETDSKECTKPYYFESVTSTEVYFCEQGINDLFPRTLGAKQISIVISNKRPYNALPHEWVQFTVYGEEEPEYTDGAMWCFEHGSHCTDFYEYEELQKSFGNEFHTSYKDTLWIKATMYE